MSITKCDDPYPKLDTAARSIWSLILKGYDPVWNLLKLTKFCRWEDKTLYLKFWWKLLFTIFFLVTNKSDFVLTKFCMSICKDVLLMEPFNLHDLYSYTDSNVLCSPELSLFWDTRFYHLSYHLLKGQLCISTKKIDFFSHAQCACKNRMHSVHVKTKCYMYRSNLACICTCVHRLIRTLGGIS